MTIKQLLVLPPFAIGRLGSAEKPMDNYEILDRPNDLGYRQITGAETLIVDEASGEIVDRRIPDKISFKIDGKIRPVAPFLEVFAVVDDGGKESILPLDLPLLQIQLQADSSQIEWRVTAANRKVQRRTGDPGDAVLADTGWFRDHDAHQLQGKCEHFFDGKFIDFGDVRYIRANPAFAQIRLRFTPGKGLIYGPPEPPPDPGTKPDPMVAFKPGFSTNPFRVPADRAVYDPSKGIWKGFNNAQVKNETLPPSLFAIEAPAPTWLNNNKAVSRGYFDDACDGIVEVRLTLPGGRVLTASARFCAAPPAVVPDSIFIRSMADDLEQVIKGPVVKDEPFEVTRERAIDIIRRAYETVRFMNVAVMNGNNYEGRNALLLDSMPEEEAADTERAIHPVMAPNTVDTYAIMTLHEQVFAALRGGAAPWFLRLLRQPDQVADFTDRGRRKMPALMCGADNNYLALTYRQIDTIRKVAETASFTNELTAPRPSPEELTAENLTAHINYPALGNPINSRPVTSVANCCPGLEVDFRAAWRRVFKGIVLREYDNLVVEVDADVTDPVRKNLAGQQLLRIREKAPGSRVFPTTTTIYGPAASDVNGKIMLTTDFNPNGLAPLEWSNALTFILHEFQGQTVLCDFTKDLKPEEKEIPQSLIEDPPNYITLEFEVRRFFEGNTAVISQALAAAGELTQGLCSPWQNDYRECSCYYWASARPDYVNVEPAGDGLSKGDNWFQKKRTGTYVADDYADTRLVLYDELFHEWERWLRFQVGGRDYEESAADSCATVDAALSQAAGSGE